MEKYLYFGKKIYYKCTEVVIEDRVLEVIFVNQGAHGIDY